MLAAIGLTAGSAAADNGYADITPQGYANFIGNGDKLSACDNSGTDGVKVRASVQKWNDSLNVWQAVKAVDAPLGGGCDNTTADVEPDSALVRVHIWTERSSTGANLEHDYSRSFHADNGTTWHYDD
ncbi:hypothetical protein G5C51_24095 [Streptomyces sp. A7024]|uniref:Uncharacterized protein n=1 Tax=Streptomyces coryli TaxID=1128680 RepID=A0A6G4U5I7_9ACTN|nr:hypothetical protein [Streptomyces coryli]NGN66976.1 hypothetical protein [Streptomyces coryli]